jgi:8-amino-7-oxononanoate synthase
VLDFASSLYLGFRHPSRLLDPWESLTVGAPAALDEPAKNKAVAQAVARLQGCDRGLPAPSTLHLFWDLFGILGRETTEIFMDAGTYPIARWGVERAAGRGASVRLFRHYDAAELRQILRRRKCGGIKPLIVTDGFCTACGRPAPVAEFQSCAREFNGLLVIDDTQSLGILGHSPDHSSPYGRGGGGVLRWSGVGGPEIIVVSSLAKAFGAPMAVLSGSEDTLRLFEERSEIRVHCSQPSCAVVNAAGRALQANSRDGDWLRLRLVRLVTRFRDGLTSAGFSSSRGIFPFQTLLPSPDFDAQSMHENLLRSGVKAVLHKGGRGRPSLLSFIITAGHSSVDIDRAVKLLSEIAGIGALARNCGDGNGSAFQV